MLVKLLGGWTPAEIQWINKRLSLSDRRFPVIFFTESSLWFPLKALQNPPQLRPAHTHSRGSQATRKHLMAEKGDTAWSSHRPKSAVIHYRSSTVVTCSLPTQTPPEYTADNQHCICGASDCISLIIPFLLGFFFLIFFWRMFSFHQHVFFYVLYINPSTLRYCSNIQNFSFLWSFVLV